MALNLLRRKRAHFGSLIAPTQTHTHLRVHPSPAERSHRRRRFRALVHESLEMRAMMAANPVAQDWPCRAVPWPCRAVPGGPVGRCQAPVVRGEGDTADKSL